MKTPFCIIPAALLPVFLLHSIVVAIFSISLSSPRRTLTMIRAEEIESSLGDGERMQTQTQTQIPPATTIACNNHADSGDTNDDADADDDADAYADDYLQRARNLTPPRAESIHYGDTEGAEWWMEHREVLRRAWDQWEQEQTMCACACACACTQQCRLLPPLVASRMVDPELHRGVDRALKEPSLENEHRIHLRGHWEEILGMKQVRAKVPNNNNNNININNNKNHRNHHSSPFVAHSVGDNDNDNDDNELVDKVFRHKNFLTPEGVRLLRSHLDAISSSGIPTRRPNAMNRNGLLFDTASAPASVSTSSTSVSIPGGVSGDAELQAFLEDLVRDYLRPLGRSFFPAFCGNPEDDAFFYAFTIRYEHQCGRPDDGDENEEGDSPPYCDRDLKEHSDASLYTLNLNLNLPGEEYSGSSLYFVTLEEADDSNNTNATIHRSTKHAHARNQRRPRQRRRHELTFEPGTAVLHRGMTRHGALPLGGGKRNNLVIWLHGPDGYVRTASYPKHERLSVQERWTLPSPLPSAYASTTTFPTTKEAKIKTC